MQASTFAVNPAHSTESQAALKSAHWYDIKKRPVPLIPFNDPLLSSPWITWKTNIYVLRGPIDVENCALYLALKLPTMCHCALGNA
jgi:hypothetical protein